MFSFCIMGNTTIILHRFQKHHFIRLVNGLKLPDFHFRQQRSVNVLEQRHYLFYYEGSLIQTDGAS